jgi:hypothetical protein
LGSAARDAECRRVLVGDLAGHDGQIVGLEPRGVSSGLDLREIRLIHALSVRAIADYGPEAGLRDMHEIGRKDLPRDRQIRRQAL